MRSQFLWQLRNRAIPLGQRTQVMGIVNVTPDSFSDGGTHAGTTAAVDHALRLLDEGADLLDVGGESTRPGSPAATGEAIATEVEQRRVLPVIEGILRVRPEAVISIDTYRNETARRAVAAGAEIVNDVSGLLWDERMAHTVAELGCGVVVMHTRGLPSEWKAMQPLASDKVLPLVRSELHDRLEHAVRLDISRARIAMDPGFGFGKRGAENWTLLAQLQQIDELCFPLVVGLARKGFLAPDLPAYERDAQTHAANTVAILHGAHIVRVHDAAGARRAADVADAVLAAAR